MPEDIPKEVKEYFRKFGSEGGKKAAKGMTPAERRKRAVKAAKAKWAKKKKK